MGFFSIGVSFSDSNYGFLPTELQPLVDLRCYKDGVERRRRRKRRVKKVFFLKV
ncbi:hypothetical protein Pint_26799 [Pistacia integerrima]|uniref:Uncharacterized protein n=1 Tax=Pistacia integerrima TaxID=434235 RepID=A0ACC0YPX9_9ROSI|nr:hypothetical protein Pint_26799 [Pistacia integerrima]